MAQQNDDITGSTPHVPQRLGEGRGIARQNNDICLRMGPSIPLRAPRQGWGWRRKVLARQNQNDDVISLWTVFHTTTCWGGGEVEEEVARPDDNNIYFGMGSSTPQQVPGGGGVTKENDNICFGDRVFHTVKSSTRGREGGGQENYTL